MVSLKAAFSSAESPADFLALVLLVAFFLVVLAGLIRVSSSLKYWSMTECCVRF